MNKHTVIVLIAIIIIIGTFSYSFVNATTSSELQLRWYQKGSFDYLTMMAGGKVEVCNPTSIPIDFKKIRVEPYYKEQKLGSYEIDGNVLLPRESSEFFGSTDKDNAGQILLMYLDTELSGNDVARIDSSQMKVLTTVDTTILGFIPYSTTSAYNGVDFSQMMNHDERFSC